MRKNHRSMNDRSSHTVEQRGVKLLGVRMNHKTLKKPTLRVYYRDGKTLSSVWRVVEEGGAAQLSKADHRMRTRAYVDTPRIDYMTAEHVDLEDPGWLC